VRALDARHHLATATEHASSGLRTRVTGPELTRLQQLDRKNSVNSSYKRRKDSRDWLVHCAHERDPLVLNLWKFEETIRDGQEQHGPPKRRARGSETAVSGNHDPGRRLFCRRHLVRGRLIQDRDQDRDEVELKLS